MRRAPGYARSLGTRRSASRISRERRLNAATRGGVLDYRAITAQRHAERAARRKNPAKLAVNAASRTYVQDRLAGLVVTPSGAAVPGPTVSWKGRRHGPRQNRRWASAWSPKRMAHRLWLDSRDDETMRIGLETIYQSLYIQGRGALRLWLELGQDRRVIVRHGPDQPFGGGTQANRAHGYRISEIPLTKASGFSRNRVNSNPPGVPVAPYRPLAPLCAAASASNAATGSRCSDDMGPGLSTPACCSITTLSIAPSVTLRAVTSRMPFTS